MHLPHKEFLRLWRLKPVAVADCIIVKDNKVLLVKRATPPFNGTWCLPGGCMNVEETIEQTALRELREETGVTGKIIALIGVYSGPKRDPRGTSVSAAFLVKAVKTGMKHDSEVSDIEFFPINKLPRLGFDHKRIVNDALKLLRSKGKTKTKHQAYG